MEEIKKNEDYFPRANKQSRFDKRLIQKIVKEVEQGLPRKEANRIYGLGKASLDNWMSRYGSPEYRENIKRRTYTNLQKRTIVTTIEQSRMSIKEAQIAYNIKTEKTIREWLSLFKLEKSKFVLKKHHQWLKRRQLLLLQIQKLCRKLCKKHS